MRLIGCACRARVAVLSPEVPRRQRRARGLAAAALLAALLAVGFGGQGSESSNASSALVPATAPGPKTKPYRLVTGGRLEPGERGLAVRKLQKALILLGMDPGKPDGAYGERTAGAVAAFKTSRGLPADGIVDRRTVRQINRVLAEIAAESPAS